jgi:hypothetical protein
MHLLNIKPLSVNDAWQGRRFKTPEYKRYARDIMYLLPKFELPPAPYALILEFGVGANSDWDNPVKPFQDIMQKKYGFNDRDVRAALVRKKTVKKGEEYIYWSMITFDEGLCDRIDKSFFSK